MRIRAAIREITNRAEDRRRFVSDLFQAVNAMKPTNFNVMVLDLKQFNEIETYVDYLHEKVEKFGRRYGIWIFLCGEIENEGTRNLHYWKYNRERVYLTERGEDAVFYHESCPHQDFRRIYQKKD